MNRAAVTPFCVPAACLACATLFAAAPLFAAPPLPRLPSAETAPAGDRGTGDKVATTPSAAASTGSTGTDMTAPAAGSASIASAAASTAQRLYEHVRRGLVLLERNGAPLAVGTVLGGDGRILTALSGLGGVDTTDVRYADGSVVRAKVKSSDKAIDLALLVPQSGRWTEGLAASESDPLGVPLRAMLPTRGTARLGLGPTEAGVKGHAEAHSRDGEPVPALEVDVKGPPVAGAPLLDATGSVAAVLARACKGAAEKADPMPWAAWAAAQESAPKARSPTPVPPCSPTVVAVPVSAIRSFLAKTPATAALPSPWLGVRVEAAPGEAVRGVRIVAVAPASPAQKAGLKPESDLIVAADGQPIHTPEKLADAIAKHATGDTMKLLVFGEDKFREAAVTLRAAP